MAAANQKYSWGIPVQTKVFTTSDDVSLVYDAYGDPATAPNVILFIHGWSGSRRYFDPALEAYARGIGWDVANVAVVAPDLRGHGESSKPPYGMHISRLACDLRELMNSWGNSDTRITLVGTSMGCACIWTYLELFGKQWIKGVVLVDQAPMQYNGRGWHQGSNGCYDAKSMEALLKQVQYHFEDFALGNAAACVADGYQGSLDLMIRETLRASPEALCDLMYDHAPLDHRPLCRRSNIPALVLVGKLSKIFPWQGCAAVGAMMRNSVTLLFPGEGHWLYIEEAHLFMLAVTHFVDHGTTNQMDMPDPLGSFLYNPIAESYVIAKTDPPESRD